MISKKELKNSFNILIGAVIYVIGINLFLAPSNIFTVGVLGFSQEVSFVLNGSFSLAPIFYFILNIPVILIGYFKVGKRFTIRTFITIFLVSALQRFIPTDQDLLKDVLLNVLTGSILIGTGLGLILKQGASTGGTDVLALYLSLVRGKGFGYINILVNSIVIVLAYFVTSDFSTSVYMVISLYVMGILIDRIHNSHQRLTLLVVTKKAHEIRDAIFEQTGRGCTILDSYGGQEFTKNNTVMITISKSELYITIKTLKEADEHSFINVLPVESVVGFFQNNFKRILE